MACAPCGRNWVSACGDEIRIAAACAGAYHKRVIFQRLHVWLDPVRRCGPEAMAVDEWLLETADAPVLRIYEWLGDWGSVGYFGKLEEAKASIPEVRWVRRWTGGGTVDHRADWTYTVVAPCGESLAGLRGAESYRILHAALAEAMMDEGADARLSNGSEETGAALCFENPVSHDLVGAGNRKLAGAGQRRTSQGLLHQGSVAAPCDPGRSMARAECLAARLAEEWRFRLFDPPEDVIASKVLARYAAAAWTERR